MFEKSEGWKLEEDTLEMEGGLQGKRKSQWGVLETLKVDEETLEMGGGLEGKRENQWRILETLKDEAKTKNKKS